MATSAGSDELTSIRSRASLRSATSLRAALPRRPRRFAFAVNPPPARGAQE